jgi:hypothetical protein
VKFAISYATPYYGVTRIVVGASATDPDEQRDEMSAFAQRFALDHATT